MRLSPLFFFLSISLAAAAETEKPRFVSKEFEVALRKMIPTLSVEVGTTAKLADDPNLILYTEQSMPRVYQFNLAQRAYTGFHSANYNISANGSEPYGNGNKEFPWGDPGGTHRCDNVHSFKFLLLPAGCPIVWWNENKGDVTIKRWVYPVGAKVGEVLYMHGSDGIDYTFEMRVRERIFNDWAIEIWRPYPTADHLRKALKTVPDFVGKDRLASHLKARNRFQFMTLSDKHPKESFRIRTQVDTLPAVSEKGARLLLTNRVFYPALGETWDAECHAPTTLASFHIVPKNYDAAFLGTSPSSCMKCHESTNKDVNDFQPRRDWYGRISGDDGVFSFNPNDPSCVSHNGEHIPAKMLQAKYFVEQFDPTKHPHELYQVRVNKAKSKKKSR